MALGFNDLCIAGGRMLNTPQGLDGYQLLRAIGIVESSAGKNANPRFEPAFNWGGKYERKDLLRQYGSLAACSLGEWQVMYCNVWDITGGQVTPLEMFQGPTAMIVSVKWMNERILTKGATTLQQIADAWNSGSFRDSFVPEEYIAKVSAAYWGL